MAQQSQQQQSQEQQQEDALAVAQNGGVSSSDEGDMDGDDLDDDMMDRISSSPSIEDGVYYCYPDQWPPRMSSLPLHLRAGQAQDEDQTDCGSPKHNPPQDMLDHNYHHLRSGEYRSNDNKDDDADDCERIGDGCGELGASLLSELGAGPYG